MAKARKKTYTGTAKTLLGAMVKAARKSGSLTQRVVRGKDLITPGGNSGKRYSVSVRGNTDFTHGSWVNFLKHKPNG